MGEQFGNLVRQYPWHIVCLVSLLFIVVQGLLIFLAKKNNWKVERYKKLIEKTDD